MVSSVLRNGLYINTLMSRCRETWAGGRLAHVGGGWLGIRGQYWTFKENVGALRQRVVKPPRHAFSARVIHYILERV